MVDKIFLFWKTPPPPLSSNLLLFQHAPLKRRKFANCPLKRTCNHSKTRWMNFSIEVRKQLNMIFVYSLLDLTVSEFHLNIKLNNELQCLDLCIKRLMYPCICTIAIYY